MEQESSQDEPKLVKKDISAIFSASNSQTSKSMAMFSGSSSKSTPFLGKSGPFSAGKSQGLSTAFFGKSSFGKSSFGTSSSSTKPVDTPESKPLFNTDRKFGGGFRKDNNEPTASAFGFKQIASSAGAQTNSFLASGANAREDNDMATDEDIFGSGNPTFQGMSFGMHLNPTPFSAKPPMSFGQAAVPNKSSPSFTQRRK